MVLAMNSGYEYAICSAIAGGCWQPLMKACHKTDAAFCNLYFNGNEALWARVCVCMSPQTTCSHLRLP